MCTCRQRNRNVGRGKAFGRATFDEKAKESTCMRMLLLDDDDDDDEREHERGPVVIRMHACSE